MNDVIVNARNRVRVYVHIHVQHEGKSIGGLRLELPGQHIDIDGWLKFFLTKIVRI